MHHPSRLIMPARLEEIRQACDFVVEVAELAGLDERSVYHSQMAVDEALTNIIEHGFGFQDRGSEIEITCKTENDRFIITIIDTGPAFDPLAHEAPNPAEPLDSREPGGWGIYFIRRLMDEVTYRRIDGKNQLTLVKLIPASSQAVTRVTGEEMFPVQVLDTHTAIVSPDGRLDSTTSPNLEKTLNAQLDHGRNWLVVDMTDVEYIASSGLKVLVAAWRRARDGNGDVVLSGLQPRIVEIFEMVGFDMLFQLFADLDTALAARSLDS